MKIKALGITLAASFVLAACGAGDNGNETGLGINEGVKQTRYNHPTDDIRDNADDNNLGQGLNSQNMANDVRNQYDRDNTNRDNNLENRNLGDNSIDRNQEGTNQNNSMNLESRNLGNQDNDNNQDYEISEKASKRIADKVAKVDRAYVLTNGNNAYVAVQLNRGTNSDNGDIDDNTRRQIEKAVNAVDDDINNVYVSANPDFVDLSNNYIEDANNGQPVEGFFEQFGNMIERIFPNAR